MVGFIFTFNESRPWTPRVLEPEAVRETDSRPKADEVKPGKKERNSEWFVPPNWHRIWLLVDRGLRAFPEARDAVVQELLAAGAVPGT